MDLLRITVKVIGWLTVGSGAVQLVAPEFVLGIVSAKIDGTTSHFFAIVGMFMVLFGGLLLHALATEPPTLHHRVALLWCALQKLGASAAVGLGVVHDVFSPLAVAIAGFDLVSGVIIWRYRARGPRRP